MLLLLCCTIHAQYDRHPFFGIPDSATSSYGISGDYYFGSNCITSKFASDFYTGEFLSETLKDKVSSKLKQQNRFGADANAGIYYMFRPDSLFGRKSPGFLFALRDSNHTDAGFSEDAFRLGFYGNKQYLGDTANLDELVFNSLSYQQFTIGFLFTQKSYLGLSFLKGSSFSSIIAPKARLFTSPDATYLEFDTKYSAFMSDSSGSGYDAFNGYGASLDIIQPIIMTISANLTEDVIISLTEFGFIHWNENSRHFRADSTFKFSGFSVASFSDLQDSAMYFSPDSVFNPEKSNGPYIQMTPAALEIVSISQGEKWRVLKGYRFIFNSNNRAKWTLGLIYNFTPKFTLATLASYGGYSNFQLGLHMNAELGKGWRLKLHSDNLLGYIIPKNSTSQGIFAGVTRNLYGN